MKCRWVSNNDYVALLAFIGIDEQDAHCLQEWRSIGDFHPNYMSRYSTLQRDFWESAHSTCYGDEAAQISYMILLCILWWYLYSFFYRLCLAFLQCSLLFALALNFLLAHLLLLANFTEPINKIMPKSIPCVIVQSDAFLDTLRTAAIVYSTMSS